MIKYAKVLEDALRKLGSEREQDQGLLQAMAFLSMELNFDENQPIQCQQQRALLFNYQLEFDRAIDKRLAQKCKGNANASKFHLLPSGRMEKSIKDSATEPAKSFADDILEQFPAKVVQKSCNEKANYRREESLPKRARQSKEEESEQEKQPENNSGSFMSATRKLRIDDAKNGVKGRNLKSKTARKPSLSNSSRRTVQGDEQGIPGHVRKGLEAECNSNDEEIPEELRGLDPKLVEMITNEIMSKDPGVHWADIAGLEEPKRCVREIVVWPMLRPDLFTGLRGPPKGILLFGPPGTGKTMIGKAIASECNATFFSISASSLTSKWHGEGEKLVRTLFAVANLHKPAVIFVDEIDSLLSQRSSSEFEGSRRLKTEFLVQLDGAHTSQDDRVVLIGATNRPQELDEAARRRLVKRLYIPLPSHAGRLQLVKRLLSKEKHSLSEEELSEVSLATRGYSGADIKALATEAAFGPIRELTMAGEVKIGQVEETCVRSIEVGDFQTALKQVRPSVSPGDLNQYLEWNDSFGSFPIPSFD